MVRKTGCGTCFRGVEQGTEQVISAWHQVLMARVKYDEIVLDSRFISLIPMCLNGREVLHGS